MTATATASVIICVYTDERWDDINEAVASLRAMSTPPDEIVIVADHNPDLQKRLERKYPELRVIANQEQRGLSGARNTGVKFSKGDCIAFLDDDAVAGKDWLSLLIRECQRPNVYGAVSWIEPLWIGERPNWFPDEFLWTVGCSYRGLPKEPAVVRNLLGGAMCVRRELFDRVGGFNHRLGRTNSKLPISGEETELCIRARERIPNAAFSFQPAARIHHKVPARRLTWGYFAKRCYAEGVSKARISHDLKSATSLSTERNYVVRTIPSGLARELASFVSQADASGFGRVGAMFLGLATAAAGFVHGKVGALMTGSDAGPANTATPTKPSKKAMIV